MHIKAINAHFLFLIYVSKIFSWSSESDEYGAGNQAGLRQHSRDPYLGSATQMNTGTVFGDTLPDECIMSKSEDNQKANSAHLLPYHPQQNSNGLTPSKIAVDFRNTRVPKRKAEADGETAVEHDHNYYIVPEIKKMKFLRLQHAMHHDESTKDEGSCVNRGLIAWNVNLDYRDRLKIQFKNAAYSANHDATNVQGNTPRESANRILYFKLSECNPRSSRTSLFLDKLQPHSAYYTYVLQPTVSNRIILIEGGTANSQSKLDFSKYRDEIMKMLNTTELDPKSETETETKALITFNIWLIPKDHDQLENFCRLYYRIANLKNFKGAGETAITKVIFGTFQEFQAKYKSAWFKSALSMLSEKSSQPNVATIYVPRSVDTITMEVESIENFFSVFFDDDKRITQGYSVVSIYSAIKCAFFIHKTGYIDYVIKQNACKILHYMPEILVFMDWRMELLGYTPSDENFYEEIDHIKNIIIQFVETQTKNNEAAVSILETTIEKFRHKIKKIVDDNISCAINEMHMYTFGLESKYSLMLQSEECKNAANIFLVLAFIVKDAFVKNMFYLEQNNGKQLIDPILMLEYIKNDRCKEIDCILAMQVLIEYYNYIGLSISRKVMIFTWKLKTLVISTNGNVGCIELISQNALILLYNELMSTIQ